MQMSTEDEEKKLATRIENKYAELDALEDQDLTPNLEKQILVLNLRASINDMQIRATTDQEEKKQLQEEKKQLLKLLNSLQDEKNLLLQSQANTTQGTCLIPHLHTQNSSAGATLNAMPCVSSRCLPLSPSSSPTPRALPLSNCCRAVWRFLNAQLAPCCCC